MENPFAVIERRLNRIEEQNELISKSIEAFRQTVQEEKLLSPAETCKIFQPAISRVTLANWTAAGHLQKHMIGAKPFYKMSEVLEAGKTLKRYKTKG